jgi:transcriptional regulator with XRE-family HTH domain
MQIGHKIKRVRELKGFSQTEVAEKLNISQRTYSDIENDKTRLDLARLENLSKIFEVDPIDLLTFDDKQVFNNCTLSGNNYSTVGGVSEVISENERQAYQQQIKHLQEEIAFLRGLVKG